MSASRKIGTFCTGIHAPGMAYASLGWEDVFFSEIEPFCCEVLAHRYPNVPNLGDMREVDGREYRGKVDGLIAGTPCQAFSVAGLRGSLGDDRGNLTLQFVRRTHESDPEFVVWENVPGVLSTKDNAFGCFLAGMVGAEGPLVPCLDDGGGFAKRYWRTVKDKETGEVWRAPRWPNAGMVAGPVRTLAWRVLDAQYLGLAQRRRRVFVVSFRTGDGINPAAVLLEPESVRGDPPTREGEGAGVAGTLAPGAHPGGVTGRDAENGMLVAHALTGHHGRLAGEDNYVAAPITARYADNGGRTAGNNGGVVNMVVTQPFSIFSHNGCAKQDHAKETDVSAAVDGQGGYSPGQGGTVVAERGGPCSGELSTGSGDAGRAPANTPGSPGAGTSTGRRKCPGSGSASPADSRDSRTHGTVPLLPEVVAFSSKDHGADAGEPAPTLRAMPHNKSHANGGGQVAITYSLRAQPHSAHAEDLETYVAWCHPDLRVRRLTPRECERLQGFPDDYTLIPYHGKPAEKCPDGPRYRALGNAMAVKVMRWICERVDRVLKCKEAMAS